LTVSGKINFNKYIRHFPGFPVAPFDVWLCYFISTIDTKPPALQLPEYICQKDISFGFNSSLLHHMLFTVSFDVPRFKHIGLFQNL